MSNKIEVFIRQIRKDRQKRRKALFILTVLSLFVAGSVVWQLRLTGITMSNDTHCGIEAHQHDESCYTKTLICGYEEQETQTAEKVLLCTASEHLHSEACFEEKEVLVCTLDDAHVHSDECYETQTVQLCEQSEHTHSDTCWETPIAETGADAHLHTDECYEISYSCDLEEHLHTSGCYSDPNADVETAADWETSLPDTLTGDWGSDLLATAKSQLGYTESSRNYAVTEDGELKGYTRYGAWYGNPYGDWEAMFVSFCLHYAGLPEEAAPVNSGVEALRVKWEELDLLGAEDYIPEPGDLVFLDLDEDGKADQIGVVTKLSETEETLIFAISGNVSNAVAEEEYRQADVLCYGSISSAYARAVELGLTETDNSADTVEDAPDSGVLMVAAEGANEATISNYTHTYTDINGVSQSWTGTITFTATLPQNSRTSGYTLCADAWSDVDGDNAYANAIKAYLGETNDIQYYDIYWKDGNGTRIELEDGTSVKISWDDSGCLYGVVAKGRVPHVLPLNDETKNGFTSDAEQVITSLTIKDGEPAGFSSITFTAAKGGPYAVVSMRVYMGYVSDLTVSVESDGTPEFNTEKTNGTLVESDNGYDTDGRNGVVRSFDTVEYKLTATTSNIDNTFTAADAAIRLEVTMEMGLTEAQFDLSKMTWIGTDYLIEYLDAAGNVVAIRDADCGDGYVKLVTNGTAAASKTSVNDLTNGSNAGESSYGLTNGEITTQRITGTYQMAGTSATPFVVPGTQSLSVGIKVLNAKNGDQVKPTFRVWLKGNEKNYGYDSSDVAKEDTVATPQPKSETLDQAYSSETNSTAYAVTVSAGALYNVEVDQNDAIMYAGWFDFEKGNEVSAVTYSVNGKSVSGSDLVELLEALAYLQENWGKSNPAEYTDEDSKITCPDGTSLSDYASIFSSIRYGRMYGYGITLQVAGLKADGGYGMKGMSLPVGEITFGLQISTNATVTDTADADEYYSILWDSYENVLSSKGKQNRNLAFMDYSAFKTAEQAAPLNSGTNVDWSCYNGGTWTSQTTSSADTPDGQIYKFTVSGYDIDLEDYTFPVNKATSSGEYAAYKNYKFCFSAGQIQVLSVYPRYTPAATVTDTMTVTAGDLKITSLSGQKLSPTEGADGIDYSYETNPGSNDNALTQIVAFYKPGNIQKRNSLVKRTSYHLSDGFLGKKGSSDGYWVTDWDSSAFIGDTFAIMGCLYKNTSDAQISAINMLQLFDSKALCIDETKGSGAKTSSSYYPTTLYSDEISVFLLSGTYESLTILYAADPDYRNGYDTNAAGVQDYMNTVREEDLVYYESLDTLESEGYTCVGVLAELRGCKGIENSYNMGRVALRIPVKVKDDPSIVGTTVSTINAVRAWVTPNAMMNGNSSISWKDGEWNVAIGKNVLADYQTITPLNSSGAGNGFKVENSGGTGGYTKVEYQDGKMRDGHIGGTVAGESLLILGYESHIVIDSEKADGQKSYDLSHESGVTYTLSSIQTVLGTDTETSSDITTELTIGVSLTGMDENGKELTGDALDAHMLNGMFCVNEETISNDPDKPTAISAEYNGKTYTVTLYVELASDQKSAAIHISGAPVGATLPDITFQAQLGDNLGNGSKVTATATIGGTGDARAYDAINGNLSTDTVSIINLSGSALSKRVDKQLIELEGGMVYTITYTNFNNTALTQNGYFYDILPYNGDIRGTDFTVSTGEDGGGTSLTAIAADNTLDSGEKADFQGTIQLYYSTKDATTLRNTLEGFSEQDSSAIDAMLADTSDNSLFSKLGTLQAGTDGAAEFAWDSGFDSNLSSKITCIYAVVENMGANRSLNLYLTLKTTGGAGADVYGNLAWGWVPEQGGVLRSAIVQTAVVSRSISGVVWYDANLNGVCEDGEKTLSGVTCTLFQRDANGSYAICTTDVTGETIAVQTTGTDGAYDFTRLAPGDYVVAFSLPQSDSLGINGATVYQANGKNDGTTNDGVALKTTDGSLDKDSISFTGISSSDYDYAIAYSLSEQFPTAMALHSIEQYESDTTLLTNYQENYIHQDLGLTYTGYELPETGGAGTTLYTMGGLLLMAAAVLLLYNKAKRGKEDYLSS